jgi:hypothetical protein
MSFEGLLPEQSLDLAKRFHPFLTRRYEVNLLRSGKPEPNQNSIRDDRGIRAVKYECLEL